MHKDEPEEKGLLPLASVGAAFMGGIMGFGLGVVAVGRLVYWLIGGAS